MAEKLDFPTYKGRPLVRCGNILFYGSLADDFVIMMMILSTKKVGGAEIADKVQVELQHTDPAVPPKDRVVKISVKDGLYSAIEIASIWLERALEK